MNNDDGFMKGIPTINQHFIKPIKFELDYIYK